MGTQSFLFNAKGFKQANRRAHVRNFSLFGYTYSDFDSLLKKKKKSSICFGLGPGPLYNKNKKKKWIKKHVHAMDTKK